MSDIKKFESQSAFTQLDRLLIKNGSLTDEQIHFLYENMNNNLDHARHIEGERLSFNSIFLTVAGAVLAFVKDFTSPVAALLFFAVAVEGAVSMTLTKNWGNAFDHHWYYAAGCYRVLHHALIEREGKEAPDHELSDAEIDAELEKLYGGEVDRNFAEFGEYQIEHVAGLDVHPLFCFRIAKPFSKNPLMRIRTKTLYAIFYGVIEMALIGAFLIALFSWIHTL